MNIPLFYSFINCWTFGFFYFLAVVDGAVMNIHVKAFVWTPVFNSLGSIPKTRVAVSYSSTVFKFLRNQRMAPLLLLKIKIQQPKHKHLKLYF